MSVTKGAFRTFFAHVSPLRLQQFIGLGWSLQGISCTFYLGLKKVIPSPLHGFWIKKLKKAWHVDVKIKIRQDGAKNILVTCK